MPEESTKPDLEEKTRQLVEAGNRRDFDAMLDVYAPEPVWHARQGGLVLEGREAIRDYLNDWIGPYDDFEQELEEFRDLDDGVTFAVLHQRARLPGSSRFVELRYGAVGQWAEGLLERMATYLDIDQARAAAERLAVERANG